VATFLILSAVAFGFTGQYNTRVLPGVHVGSVDLSGMTHDEAIAELKSSYAYLGQGEVTLTTPVGATTITYQQVDRGPDVEAMVDAAMAVGHTGSSIEDAAIMIHTAVLGQDIPVVVEVDPTALAERVRALVSTSSVAAQDAQATAKGGVFSMTPAVPGSGIDENSIGSAIIDQLADVNAPGDLQAAGTFVSLDPQVSNTDAENAIQMAQNMASADLKITWNVPPASATGTWKPRSWTITKAQIGTWIVFGTRQDGTYAPAVDPAQVKVYLTTISSTANFPATNPSVVFDPKSGKPTKLTAGNNGAGIDLNATTTAVSSYLDGLAAGASLKSGIEVTTVPISPTIKSVADTSGYVNIGSWTTTFYPGPANGNGANIRVPAQNLNGQVIAPGQQLSFLSGVGPIDVAHGFTTGGVILDGRSDHTGAIGGGICSASTTMFNAAAKAGLQIDERHAHFYYISRYPIGRDATVYSNGSSTWDLKWTNDTPNPIVIHSWATHGYKSYITIQLWSLPLNRHVTWTGDNKAGETNIVKATDNSPQWVSTLRPGKTYAVEVRDNGFDTSVTRVVKDASGKIIHTDHWSSHYTAVDGQLQIGITPSPSPTPISTPTPSQSPPPSPALLVPPLAMLLGVWRRRMTWRRKSK
jgi:vancomycin resistance protein YoaR